MDLKAKKITTMFLFGLVLTATVLTGCSTASVKEESLDNTEKKEVVVAAAASLKEATTDI